MNKQIKRLHSRIVKGIMPVKDLEREMKLVETRQGYPLDFETIAQSKGITVRELVQNWDFHCPEQNNY